MLRSTILCATLLAVIATAGGKCGPVICSPGQVCCDDQYCMDLWSGGSCTEKAKNKAEAAVKAAGERCGPYVCGAGQICCDDTYCMTVWSGGTCNETNKADAVAELKAAADLKAAGGKCGREVCNPGQVCCNDSYCIDLWSGGCGEKRKNANAAELKVAGEPCGPYVCGAGQICCNNTFCMTVWSGGTCNETKNLAAKVVAAAAELNKAAGGKCGPVICSPGQVCCDDQYCMDLWSGGSCTEKAKKKAEAAVKKASGERCGPFVCGAGQICCDDTYCMTVWSGGTCTEAAKKAKAAAAAVVAPPAPCATRKCNAASKCCATDLGADYCAPMWDRCVARMP